MKQFFYVFIATVLSLLSCSEDRPVEPPPMTDIKLFVEDVGVTDAVFRVSLPDSGATRTIGLYRDGVLIQAVDLAKRDTILIDEGLQPSHDYAYYAARLIGDKEREKSHEEKITTMGVTSSAFQWKLDTLGDGGSSILFDVCIIDENNIYAVGEIYRKDSLGKWDHTPYNLAHWDGISWKLLRIQFYTFCNQPFTDSYGTRAIWANSPNDIWISANSQVTRWDGTKQGKIECIPVSVNKIFGTSSNSIYAVGYNGGIAYYNGFGWQKLASGTDADINDIWGVTNKETGKQTIYCAVSRVYYDGQRKIIQIPKMNTIPWPSNLRVHSIWYKNEKRVFASGDGVFIKRFLNSWREQPGLPRTYTRRIRGTEINDVFVAGDFGNVLHFNGMNWRKYSDISQGILFHSMDYKENLMVAVGELNPRAIILRMWR